MPGNDLTILIAEKPICEAWCSAPGLLCSAVRLHVRLKRIHGTAAGIQYNNFLC